MNNSNSLLPTNLETINHPSDILESSETSKESNGVLGKNSKPKSNSQHYDSDTEEEAEAKSCDKVVMFVKGSSKELQVNKSQTFPTKVRMFGEVRNKGPKYKDDNVDENYDGFGDSSDSENDGDVYANMKPEKQQKIKEFFSNSSEEELCFLSGCSAKKAKKIIEQRPFSSWRMLLNKFESQSGLQMTLIDSCVILLKERNTLCNLMSRCSNIAKSIQNEFSQTSNGNNKFIKDQPSSIPKHLTLKAYQMIGINWISLIHRHSVNGILADEMGLGKTIQTIAFLSYLRDSGISPGPHLIVVPCSTLQNWVREFSLWCPSLKVISYGGTLHERRVMRQQILSGELSSNIIVVAYNIAISRPEDRGFFRRINSYFAVFDEGHMLKNMSSQRYQYLMRLNAKHRLLLTGTPLQNNLLELMSLLKFVMPDMFDESTQTLVKMFTHANSDHSSAFFKQRIEHAKKIMQPFVLRRLKADVLEQLPKKLDIIEHCSMTDPQKALYEKVSLMFKNRAAGKKLPKGELKNGLMELRKIANHPLLHREHYTSIKLVQMAQLLKKKSPFHHDSDVKLLEEDMEVMTDYELSYLCSQHKCIDNFQLSDEVITASGKLHKLDEMLPRYRKEGKRVLLFTQFTMVLDIIQKYLSLRGMKFLRFDGSVHYDERMQLIDTFNNDKSYFIFILSTKAGGLGINLTSASVVILHDIDFNPYNDKQAEDRCHRLGQTKTVEVVRLLAKDSIEIGMYENGLNKLKLEKDMTESNDDETNIISQITANILR